MHMILGVDTGGTFTDFILLNGEEIRTHKELSTPQAPEQAILKGIKALGLNPTDHPQLQIVHGTTVATNAALEHKGVKTAYVTNKGFADVLTIGRQARPELYNLRPEPIAPPVPPELCFEVSCRRDYNGDVITPLTEAAISNLVQQIEAAKVEAVAINLLYSFIDGSDEKAIASALPENLFVSCSHEILPLEKEYERGITTWLNSWLGPKVNEYLNTLAAKLAPWPVAIMQSSGGTISAKQAANSAVNLLLSGPAGGLAAANAIAETTGLNKLLTFDMGGTSTDVAIIDGGIGLTNSGSIGRYPAAVPMVDMITIGAGGGSIASVDDGGVLQVGPESAGASPGPACYGQGGNQATVTDANLVLERIPANTKLAGSMPISSTAAHSAMTALAIDLGITSKNCAKGIISIANEHMSQALRRISVERGVDPREFSLCCFGGAGGLHVCALADSLDMQHAIVPCYSGLLSALGMIVAPRRRQHIESLLVLAKDISSDEISLRTQQAQSKLIDNLVQEGMDISRLRTQYVLNIRYFGQSYAIAITYDGDLDASLEAFKQEYQRRYGQISGHAIELESLQVSVESDPNQLPHSQIAGKEQVENTKTVSRESLPENMRLKGPVIVTDTYATTYVEENWQVYRDAYNNLRLEKRHTSNAD